MAELADLLTGPAARHALAHRDITAVFCILRGAGVSQTRLARATGQRLSEISEIISGRQVQSVALLGDHGGIPMTAALTAHTKASEELLGTDMREPVRPRLLLALSDAHRVADHAAEDAGLLDLARQHLSRAMDCAGAGGDLRRAVANLDRLGRIELIVEQPNEALKFFQLGAATAPSPLLRATLEYDCAWALGLLGLASEAFASLRRALNHTTRPATNPGGGRILPRPCRTLRAAPTSPSVASTVPRWPSPRRWTGRNVVGCSADNFGHLAAAQLRCGELRSGMHTAKQAVNLAKGLRSMSVLTRFAPLQEAAAARRDSACQDLASELGTLRSAA